MSDVLELCISHELMEAIRKHGVETYPNECCGALLGRGPWFRSE
jgi:proteasome lid subunit RPN8/RPN11